MGVAALDAWLNALRFGYTYQNYLGYTAGDTGWSSHHPIWSGMRPTPAWLTMTLRNRQIRGDMLDVKAERMPTLRWNTAPKNAKSPTYTAVPLVACYAFRDGDRYSIALLSRKLGGKHNGADFGDGSTPVTVNLPFKTATKVAVRYVDCGDPRKSNRTEMNVTLQSRNLPAIILTDGVLVLNEQAGVQPGGLPQGSGYVYVFEGCR